MKQWLEAADEYLKQWRIRDVALLKLCVFAVGVIVGLGMPERHRKKASIAASVVFSVTYVLVMFPFLLMLDEKLKKEKDG